MKKIPIASAKRFAERYGKDQVIILCWSKEDGRTWVTTYGKTKKDCIQAAEGGNKIKKGLGWPDELCRAKPARAK